MRARRVVIELLPTRVDVAVFAGDRCTASRRVALQLPEDGTAWVRRVKALGAMLKPIVQELSASAAKAIVLYRSPTQAVDLVDLPVAAESQACEAARLGIYESLSFPGEAAVSGAVCVGRDAGGEPRHRHIVVAADRDNAIAALADMTQQAGLEFVSATPIDAAVSASVVRAFLADSRGHHATLYIGERSSLFLIGIDGALVLSRRINMGLEPLAASLSRPLHLSDRAEPITLNLDTARAIISRHGLPARDVVVDESSNLRGEHIIPVIQPMLQRFLVELRQSLRFGLPADVREGVTIHCKGPGSALPGFADLLAQELGLTVKADETYQGYRHDEPASAGSELLDAVAHAGELGDLNLQPADLALAGRVHRLKRWLWTGAAAALIVIALDAARYSVRVNEAREEATAVEALATNGNVLAATRGQLDAAAVAMSRLEAAIDHEVGSRADLRAALQELTLVTPDAVQFSSISFQRVRSTMQGRLTGFASQATGSSQRTALPDFIANLRQSALFEEVVLGDVHTVEREGTPGERFEAIVTSVPLPVDLPGLTPANLPAEPGERMATAQEEGSR